MIEVARDVPDRDDPALAIELMVSFESRRPSRLSGCDGVSDGRLGGSAGELSGPFRGGNLGPGTDRVEVLGGKAGLQPASPSGRLPIPPALADGAAVEFGRGGGVGLAGGGGGGALVRVHVVPFVTCS